MKKYYVEFNNAGHPCLWLYIMAYSPEHVQEIFSDYNLNVIDQTD